MELYYYKHHNIGVYLYVRHCVTQLKYWTVLNATLHNAGWYTQEKFFIVKRWHLFVRRQYYKVLEVVRSIIRYTRMSPWTPIEKANVVANMCYRLKLGRWAINLENNAERESKKRSILIIWQTLVNLKLNVNVYV